MWWILFSIFLRGDAVEFSVKMQPEILISPGWMVLGITLLFVAVIFFVMLFIFEKAPKKVKPRAPKPVNRPQAFYFRQKALVSIDTAYMELKGSRIDTRESYQRLSMIMRTFVSEMTGRNATSLTLSEMKRMGLGNLSELIENCYVPEFALKTQADFKKDADKAKWMVRTWN